MKRVKIYGCFHWIGFQLVQRFLSEDIEVIGVDEINNSEKEFFYEMVGRNAAFRLCDQKEAASIKNIKEVYTFSEREEYFCTYQNGDQFVKINYRNIVTEREKGYDMSYEPFIDWLLSLKHYSIFSQIIEVNSESDNGIQLI